ncbi:MAG: glycosyltransferase [Thiomonas sp.]|uniref:glycosyltransferase n=1 Tax=Thiomonas sp. TaxID=2047785 RepID=UPI002A36E7CC|nr:glycosyltransferase [Thiomonas sp.]MDY0330918.1 glycosyltransferase [Thiomonas sp.]
MPGLIATITVTYQPDLEQLLRQLLCLPENSFKVIVDNASSPETRAALSRCVKGVKNCTLIENPINVGLGQGLNQGIDYVNKAAPHCEFVLLLDQDSEPQPGSIQCLTHALQQLRANGHELCAIGPLLCDADTHLTHGFHQMTWWRWKRTYPSVYQKVPIPVANLNGSGTLTTLSTFKQVGKLDAALFIDHIDTEWSFRLISNGGTLWGIPEAIFTHRMGQHGVRYWFLGWRVWPWRSATRHFYLFRNTLWLMRRPYVPAVWKVWAALKLLLTFLVFGIADSQRGTQLKNMWCGLKAGFHPPNAP